jgi:flagellar protein FlaG
MFVCRYKYKKYSVPESGAGDSGGESMKVQGVDPVLMNRIQEKVSNKSVQETKQALISNEHERKKRKQEEKSIEVDDLQAVVERLNKTAEALTISLLFKVGDGEPPVILVIDKITNHVLNEIPAVKAVRMLTEMGNLVGMMVDHLL